MIQGIHHIHFHVGNALQTAHFYRDKFGFRWHSYRGPQQQQRHCTSHVMQQGDIRLMFSSYIVPPTSCSSSSSSGAGTALTEREQTDTRGFFERLAAQGDSVHDVAFTVVCCRCCCYCYGGSGGGSGCGCPNRRPIRHHHHHFAQCVCLSLSLCIHHHHHHHVCVCVCHV